MHGQGRLEVFCGGQGWEFADEMLHPDTLAEVERLRKALDGKMADGYRVRLAVNQEGFEVRGLYVSCAAYPGVCASIKRPGTAEERALLVEEVMKLLGETQEEDPVRAEAANAALVALEKKRDLLFF